MKDPSTMSRPELISYITGLKSMIATLQAEIRAQAIPTTGPQEITPHDAAWRQHFIHPLANFMAARGIAPAMARRESNPSS